MSLCYVPGVTGAYIATQWPAMAVLLSFGLLRSGPFTVFHALGLAFIAYAAVRLPFSFAPYASVFGLWLIVIMGLCVWFGTTMTSMRELYTGLAIGGAVSSALAVLQYFGIETVATFSVAPPGLYVNGVQQGTVLALIAVALASERMWLWILPLAPGILLSHSRGAWLALAVGLLACFVRRLWVFGILGVAGAFYLLSPLSFADAERVFIWRIAFDNMTWLGYGPGTFYSIIIPWYGSPRYPEYAHNDAIQLAFEYGIGALLPFIIFGYALWRTDAKEWPVVVGFVTAGAYSMPLFMPVTAFLALVAVGRILRLYALDGRNSDRSRQYVVSWRWCYAEASRQAVPVASHHSAKG